MATKTSKRHKQRKAFITVSLSPAMWIEGNPRLLRVLLHCPGGNQEPKLKKYLYMSSNPMTVFEQTLQSSRGPFLQPEDPVKIRPWWRAGGVWEEGQCCELSRAGSPPVPCKGFPCRPRHEFEMTGLLTTWAHCPRSPFSYPSSYKMLWDPNEMPYVFIVLFPTS